MFDSHILAWKKHLEREQMKALLALRYKVTDDWRVQWRKIDERSKALKETPWRT